MACQEGQSNCSEQLRREKEPGRVLDSLGELGSPCSGRLGVEDIPEDREGGSQSGALQGG